MSRLCFVPRATWLLITALRFVSISFVFVSVLFFGRFVPRGSHPSIPLPDEFHRGERETPFCAPPQGN
eukprot:COSAG06_NODE_34034_length_480_cov_3.212598_2_plen_67_part_01